LGITTVKVGFDLAEGKDYGGEEEVDTWKDIRGNSKKIRKKKEKVCLEDNGKEQLG